MKTPKDPNGKNDEWVELYNNGCSDANLTDWRIGDVSRIGDILPIKVGDELILAKGAYAVIKPGGSGLLFTDGTTVWNVGEGVQFGSNLNDQDDSMFLYDSYGSEVDVVSYNCKKTPPVNCDKSLADGDTMERTISDDNESFKATQTAGGTPGKPNSSFTTKTCEVCSTPT